MNKDVLTGFMEQAKKMQEKMEEARARLSETEVTGESGAGLVRMTINGKHEVKKVYLEAQTLQENKDVIEDLIAAAANDAMRKLDRANKEQMASIVPNLPTGFKWPF